MEATVDIFIKSFAKDIFLLRYSIESIKKNVIGYRRVVLLIPQEEYDVWIDLVEYFQSLIEIAVFYVNEYGNKYLFQQACKLKAHEFTLSDYILYSDSDVIFDHPVNVQDYIKDGKPQILYTSWDKVGEAICWKAPTESVMGEEVKWEFMRRNNMVIHRSTLENINKWQPRLQVIVMSAERFSEFNLLGAYAFKFEKEKYSFVNTDDWQYEEPMGIQLWSYFKTGNEETHKHEYERALKVINKTFDLNLTSL